MEDFTVLANPLKKLLDKVDPYYLKLDSPIYNLCSQSVLDYQGLIFHTLLTARQASTESDVRYYRRTRMVNQKNRFWSILILPAEWNYFASDLECQTVDWKLKTLHLYIMYEWATVYTDHAL